MGTHPQANDWKDTMNTTMQDETSRGDTWSVTRPMTPDDREAMAALRAAAGPMKGKLQGIAAREPFDGIASRTVAPEGVSYKADTVGGVAGWWCLPDRMRAGEAVLHLHGGWFNWGTAQAFRHLVGHVAVRAGAAAFVPDYRLAPEHPFPAAVEDAMAAYRGLVAKGYTSIALAGDSAGGGLALAILSLTSAQVRSGTGLRPKCAVVLSPWTDLSLSGASMETRAEADPFLTKEWLAGGARDYLGSQDARDPLASPLFGDLTDLPPVLIHVGEDEILLDDSRRYAERFATAGGNIQLHIWEGMPHVFPASVGTLAASQMALDDIGSFLRQQLHQ